MRYIQCILSNFVFKLHFAINVQLPPELPGTKHHGNGRKDSKTPSVYTRVSRLCLLLPGHPRQFHTLSNKRQHSRCGWQSLTYICFCLCKHKAFHNYLSLCAFIAVEWKTKPDNRSLAKFISNSVTDRTNHLSHKRRGEPEAYLTAGSPTQYHGSKHTQDVYMCQLEVTISNQS